MVFCGAAFKRLIDEIIDTCQKKHGTDPRHVRWHFYYLCTDTAHKKRGCLYLSFRRLYEKREGERTHCRDSVKNVMCVVPCINMQKGNPKNIRGFKDLTRGGIRVAIGNPDLVYIGMLAVLTRTGLRACTKVSRLS